jgi:prefoldin subunit 5
MKMNALATKIQAAENDLKQLMADITQAIEKAQQAIARISSKARRPQQEQNPPRVRARPHDCAN